MPPMLLDSGLVLGYLNAASMIQTGGHAHGCKGGALALAKKNRTPAIGNQLRRGPQQGRPYAQSLGKFVTIANTLPY